MPKWDKTRDYYADLELSASASTEEVKKQFKKLGKFRPSLLTVYLLSAPS